MTGSAKSSLAALALLLAACQRPAPPLRGGTATATLTGPTAASLTPADNPAAESRQTVRREETRQTAAPVPLVRVTETPTAAGTVTVTEQFGQPPLVQTIKEETATTLGASQQDTSREISAKLASFAPIRWAGLGFLAFSLACFHPLIRTVVGGGKTIPALAATAGIICIFGPALFVGRETLILVLLATGLALAFLLVRLSHKEGQADALRSSPPTPGG